MVQNLVGTVGAPIINKDHFPGGTELDQHFAGSLAKVDQGFRFIEHWHDNRYVDTAFRTCHLVFKKLRHYPPILRKGVKTEFFPQNLGSTSDRDRSCCQPEPFR